MTWRVTLSGTDITAYVSRLRTRFQAGDICGDVEIDIADAAILVGVIVPRVPRELSLLVEAKKDGVWVSRGYYFLEAITWPQSLDARTATLWGRTAAARLGTPWAALVSKQWGEATTISAIVQELAGMCGLAVAVAKDYPVCARCYAVQQQTPAQIIRDLAERSGQVLWPQIDGTLKIAPRLYRDLPAPVVTLPSNEIVVQAIERQPLEYANRVLISSAETASGASVDVEPQYPDDECVQADGADIVRLRAVVLDADGNPAQDGTDVDWVAGAGLLKHAASQTGPATISGEQAKATDYHHVRLKYPATTIHGVYRYADRQRLDNLYITRRGTLSGNIISFELPLDFYDQSLILDYELSGVAINEWVSGQVPQDVRVEASALGASGHVLLHQSNPVACPTSIDLKSHPDKICLGTGPQGVITAVVTSSGDPGRGTIIFSLEGCGQLSSTRKVLGRAQITEELTTSKWGSISQVRLRAVPAAGTTITVTHAGANIYAAHAGRTVDLDQQLPDNTKVKVTYTGDGVAMISWLPGEPTGDPGKSPKCEVIIRAHIDDGSETGADASINVTAQDCRDVSGANPDDPNPGAGEQSPDDPDQWPEPGTDPSPPNPDDPDYTGDCGSGSLTTDGDSAFADCTSKCTCDDICWEHMRAGHLAEIGWNLNQCRNACDAARNKACRQCNLTGPAVLEPGAIGIFRDDIDCSGEISGPLSLISKDSNGYQLRMPAGGAGPFKVRGTYGPDRYCETTVDFPPCNISGPDRVPWDQDVIYTSSRVLADATITGTLHIVAVADNTITAQLPSGKCSGWIAVYDGGQFCGMINVQWIFAGKNGAIAGPAYLDAGETAFYAHDLGSVDVEYTGTLELVSAGAGGAILRMPPSAAGSETYTAAWSGPCGSSARLQVSLLYDETGRCLAPGEGCGCPPAAGSIVSNGYDPSDKSCYRVLDRRWSEASSGWMPDYCDRPTGAWRCYGLQIWSLGDGQCGQDYGYLYVATERINK